MPVVYGSSQDFSRDLYPEIEPYQVSYLKVSDLHELYYEQSGNPSGNAVVYLYVMFRTTVQV